MASAKKRLGRGLGNLIGGGGKAPDTKPAPEAGKASVGKPSAGGDAKLSPKEKSKLTQAVAQAVSMPPPGVDRKEYREVSVGQIEPNPYQPRRDMVQEKVKDLADSIRSEGLLQPIVVRQKGSRYELIAGERRWRAHQLLGLKSIVARVVEASDTSSAVISLIENLQREGLNPIEESLGYASLMGDFDLTQEGVAERVGRSRASIANSLRLLQLEREIQGYLGKGMISIGHAKVLLGLEDKGQRLLLARRIIEAGMSVRETERSIRKLKNETLVSQRGSQATNEAESAVILDLQKQISSRLNTKVELKHTPKKGRIVIEYYGNDDLQRILEKTGLQ